MRMNWIIAVLLLAAAALAIGGVACKSSKKESTTATNTPAMTAEATMAGDETMAADTPMADETMDGMANQTPIGTPTMIGATLTDYKITLDSDSAPAGSSVVFDISNIGGTDHEFHVAKTDLAPADLPTLADGSFDDEASGTTTMGHIGDIARDEEQTLTVNLEPGHYVILCNVVQTAPSGTPTSHFAQGMYTEFTVTQ